MRTEQRARGPPLPRAHQPLPNHQTKGHTVAYLNRFTVDLVTKEPMSERRLESLSAEISEWLHVLGAETDDQPINVRDKFASGHEHDASEGRCSTCNYAAHDAKNGNALI